MRNVLKCIRNAALGILLFLVISQWMNESIPAVYDITQPWNISRPPYITTFIVELSKSVIAVFVYMMTVYQIEFFDNATQYSGRLKSFFGMIATPKFLIWAVATAGYYVFISDECISFFVNALSVGTAVTRLIVACVMVLAAYAGMVLGLRKAATAEAKRERKGNMLLSLVLLAVASVTAAYVFVWLLLPALYLNGYALSNIWLFVLTVIIIFVLMRTALRCNARRRLFRQLYKAAAENGFTVEKVNEKYRSLFLDTEGESFSVTVDGKIIYCKLIPTAHSYSLMLRDDGSYGRVYNISLPRVGVLFSWERMHRHGFDADGKKVLLISPCVSGVNAHQVNRISELDNGDKVGEYSIYTAKGFINALGRRCI